MFVVCRFPFTNSDPVMADPFSGGPEILGKENLEETRSNAEEGLEPKTKIVQQDGTRLLVVLSGEDGYHCHRYTKGTFDHSWDCNQDAHGVDLEVVWSWLEDPRAGHDG
jgi:hypothetical protein